jgi:hypothetical protein
MSEEIKTGIFKRPYVAGLLITLFVFAVYLPSLDIYLRGDDFEWLGASYAGWQNPGQLLQLINHFFRPLVKLSYLIDYTLFGTEPLFYNLTTVLFHLINIFLLYVLLRRIFKRTGPPVFIALAWGISAYYSEVTLWSAGRPDSILLMFMLIVLLKLYNFDKKAERSKSNSLARQAGIIGFTLLALGSKETWILLPFLALAILWIVREAPFKSALKNTSSLFIILVLYIVIFFIMPMFSGTKSPTAYAGIDIGAAVEKLGFLLYKYFGLGDFFNGAIWQYLLLAIVYAGLTYRLFKSGNRIALFGLFWMFFTLGISLPIQYAPSRYNYLPLIGFWIMIVAFIEPELEALWKKFKLDPAIKKLLILLPFLFYVGYQSIMLQWEAQDYRKWGETHKMVAEMYTIVQDRIPHDRPLIFMDFGKREAVLEAMQAIRGHNKLMFVREPAIWQQVFLSALDSFLGNPFKERLEPVPDERIKPLLNSGNFTPLVFSDDNGFFISEDQKEKLLDFYNKNSQLPTKVQALEWAKR